MNNMDEISYWIYTKRAPCLMNYDNIIKKQQEEAQCSKDEPKNAYDVGTSPKKRKKRPLSLLDEDSVSTEKQQNLYFDVSQKQTKPLLNSCESDSMGSDLDFNIKNTSVQAKRKRPRLQKNSQAVIHKKNKVVTSTPKTTVNLRRSLRQAQQNNSHLNSSFEVFHASLVNGAHLKNNVHSEAKANDTPNKSADLPADRDHTDNKRSINLRNKSKTTPAQNGGQFEDLSDVSGFTANYIRSTKVQSNKTPRKLRCKNTRNLVKDAQEVQEDSDLVVCMNKFTNTGMAKTNTLNYSTDSSQNIINLVTVKNNKSPKADKSTSVLKFMDSKGKSRESISKTDKWKKANLNISFQSQSSGTSRYPKRTKAYNNTIDNIPETTQNIEHTPKRRRNTKNCVEFNNSDKKENPEDKVVTRTRSGRNAGLTVCQRENSILVVSNSTEQVSSMVSMNVASPTLAPQRKKKRTRQVRTKKTPNRSKQSVQKDSIRDKSGFAACFSESDDESEVVNQRKYFCA